MPKVNGVITFIAGFFCANLLCSFLHNTITYTNDGKLNNSLITKEIGLLNDSIGKGPPRLKEENIEVDDPISSHDEESPESNQLKAEENNEDGTTEGSSSDDHFCSIFGGTIPSAAELWKDNLSKIFNASKYLEQGDNYDEYKANLLHIVSPERLSRSVKNLPSRYWDRVGEILDLSYRRYVHLKEGKPGLPPRPVSILVIGGSVSMGIGCDSSVVGQAKVGPRGCAWPSRMTEIINKLNGLNNEHELFNIRPMTVGGTNTVSATTMWGFAAYPSMVKYPDIVIHAYSTNDMHVLSEKQAKAMNIPLHQMIMDVNENFVRKVLNPNPPLDGKTSDQCQPNPPLLLYFDDYIGNEQKHVLQTLSFSKAANTLSTYYGFGLMSYADMMRDIVYSDTNEHWFSGRDWPERNVHPSMSMHIVSSWAVTFYLLNLATSYCGFLGSENKFIGVDSVNPVSEENPMGYAAVNGLPELHGKLPSKAFENKPRLEKQIALPPYLKNLSLDDVTESWEQANKDMTKTLEDTHLPECNESFQIEFARPCIYGWIAQLPKHPKDGNQVDSRMRPILFSNEGWKGAKDFDKVGFSAMDSNANFVMEFKDIEKPVNVLIIMAMTSYGDKWAESMVHVDIYVANKGEDIEKVTTVSASADIPGYHDMHTSETVDHEIKVEGLEIGGTLRAKVKLVGGTTFKIRGLLLCNRSRT